MRSLALIEIALPWFRVHAVVLNDPGRLLAVHNLLQSDVMYEIPIAVRVRW
jgi:hypothetical protein